MDTTTESCQFSSPLSIVDHGYNVNAYRVPNRIRTGQVSKDARHYAAIHGIQWLPSDF